MTIEELPVYEGTKAAIKELFSQGLFDPNEAIKQAVHELAQSGAFNAAPSSPSEAAREAVPECETRDYLRGYSAAILDACELCGPNFDDTPKRREDGAWWHYGVPGEGDRFCEGNELREKYYQRFAALASSQSKPGEQR